MRTSRWLAYGSAFFALVAGLVAAAQNVNDKTDPPWFREFILKYQPSLPLVAFGLAFIVFLAQLGQGIWGPPRYRKATVQQVVDGLVSTLPGKAKHNRITLFRRVKGWRALLYGLWRLSPRPWHPAKRDKLKALWRIEWWADYLFPYIRSSEGRNPRCVSVFQVGELAKDCEGMAGRAWEDGFFARGELPRMRDTHRTLMGTLTVEEIRGRAPQDRLRVYVEETRIRDTNQLRAFQTFARHFMGQTISTGGPRPWGVMLLDSDEDSAPFDTEDETGGTFGEVFRTHGATLGYILR